MTMLLAFPLDFPPSTVEVIQDMVYMNSDTMDGRRFAAEFCSKRKGDAASRPKNADGRQPSLADGTRSSPFLNVHIVLKLVLSSEDPTQTFAERTALQGRKEEREEIT